MNTTDPARLVRVRTARRAAARGRRAPGARRRLPAAPRRLARRLAVGHGRGRRLGGRRLRPRRPTAGRRRTPWTQDATATSTSPCTGSTTPPASRRRWPPRASTPTSATTPTPEGTVPDVADARVDLPEPAGGPATTRAGSTTAPDRPCRGPRRCSSGRPRHAERPRSRTRRRADHAGDSAAVRRGRPPSHAGQHRCSICGRLLRRPSPGTDCAFGACAGADRHRAPAEAGSHLPAGGTSVALLEQRELEAGRPLEAGVERVPRRTRRWSDQLGARLDERRSPTRRRRPRRRRAAAAPPGGRPRPRRSSRPGPGSTARAWPGRRRGSARARRRRPPGRARPAGPGRRGRTRPRRRSRRPRRRAGAGGRGACWIRSHGRAGLRRSSVASASSRCSQNSAERPEPGVHLGQRRRVDGVEPAPPSARTVAKPLSRSTLSCIETAGCPIPNSSRDHLDHVAGRLLAVGEQLQDPAPDRVAEDVEGVHRIALVAAGSCTPRCSAPRRLRPAPGRRPRRRRPRAQASPTRARRPGRPGPSSRASGRGGAGSARCTVRPSEGHLPADADRARAELVRDWSGRPARRARAAAGCRRRPR